MIPHIILTNKKEAAEEFIKKYLDDSIQYIQFYPEGEKIKIEQIRNLRKILSFHFEKNVVVVLWWFDKATIEAQNASLKILEEYSDQVDFFLVIQNINKLLPTILSRTIVKDIRKHSLKEFNKDFRLDLRNFWPEAKTKDKALEVLSSLLFYFRKNYKKNFDLQSVEIVKEILKVINLLENNNLNPQLSVDYILSFCQKKFNIKI